MLQTIVFRNVAIAPAGRNVPHLTSGFLSPMDRISRHSRRNVDPLISNFRSSTRPDYFPRHDAAISNIYI